MKRLIILIGCILLSATPLCSQDAEAVGRLHNFITEWWRVPYKYGGLSKNGIDCSAFTQKLFKEVYGTVLPRTAGEQYKATKRIQKEELRDGDLVFFRTNTKSTWHVGVYITAGFFVHSGSGRGVFINNLNEPQYRQMYYGAGRMIQDKKPPVKEKLLI